MKPSEQVLAHYGIPGMQWGRRKNPDGSYSKSSAKPAATSEDAAKANTLKKKAATSGTDALSNKELQDLNTRMNLETQYAKMAPTKVKKGKEVYDTINKTGKMANEAINMYNSPVGKLVREGIKNAR